MSAASSDPWHCTLCSVTSTVDDIENHFSNQLHQEILYRSEHMSATWLCELCNTDIDGGLADIECHLRTSDHKERCSQYPTFYTPAPPAGPPPYEAPPPPPTTTPPPFPPSHVVSNSAENPDSHEFWCDLCQRGMQLISRDNHLVGTAHKKKVKAASYATQPDASASAPPPINNNANEWKCELCQRSMQLEQKDIHLSGADHIRRQQILTGSSTSAQWTCEVCERSMQIDQREPHLRGTDHLKKEKNMGTWYCTVCNRVMQAGQRDEHLRGADHLALVPPGEPDPATDPSSPPPAPLPADTDIWNCTVCNRAMQSNQRELHEGGLEHIRRVRAQPTGEWTCVPCGRTMHIDSKAMHEGGLEHLKKLRGHGIEEWKCVPCGRTMHIDSKVMHEGGIAHIKAVARARNAQAGIGPMWSCDVCGRTMQSEQQPLHLGGQEHLKAVRRRDMMLTMQAEAEAAAAAAATTAATATATPIPTAVPASS